MKIYHKIFNPSTGGVHATIFFLQLNYWFNKVKKPFFKFLMPPTNHLLYKIGDSWTEELGFTITELRTSIRKTTSKISLKEDKRLIDLGLILSWKGGNNLTVYCPNYVVMAMLPQNQQDILEQYYPYFRKWKMSVQKAGILFSEITISTFRKQDFAAPYIQNITQDTKSEKNTERGVPDFFSDQNELVQKNVKEKSSAKKEIVYPYETENFITTWESWKTYKKENFDFEFNEITEQAGLKILAVYNEDFSIQLLEQAISNGWKNFHFEETPQKFKYFLKNQTKPNEKHKKHEKTSGEKFEKHVARFFQKHQGKA